MDSQLIVALLLVALALISVVRRYTRPLHGKPAAEGSCPLCAKCAAHEPQPTAGSLDTLMELPRAR